MKTKVYLIASCLLFCSMSGCRNPLMERVLINLYHIGDRGPGGGIIFYRSEKGFTDTYSGKTHHFLEAAPVDQGSAAWAPTGSPAFVFVSGAVGTGIGTGRKNTASILNTTTDPAIETPAAFHCDDYAGGGKTDWFLPSKDELNELYRRRSYFIFSSTLIHWSSSQHIDISENAWTQNFNDGTQEGFMIAKYGSFSVRAIRSF